MERRPHEFPADLAPGPDVGPSPIDEHLARFEGEQLATLQELRRTIGRLLPDAVECITYGMPAFTVNGKAVAGFDGFKRHCSYFPHSGSVVANVGPLPEWCDAEKGTLRFPIGRRLPDDLVQRLIDVRLAEINARATRLRPGRPR